MMTSSSSKNHAARLVAAGSLAFAAVLGACSGTDQSTGPGQGEGGQGVGGSSATGAAPSLGGSSAGSQATGGTVALGGGSVSTGGTSTTGAGVSTGGTNATGGTAPSGGTKATGGINSTGGAPGGSKSTGGTTAVGGFSGAGGTLSTGGSKATGGTISSGGAVTGGSKATGGMQPTGGTAATGGSKATGGALSTGGTKATGGAAATGGTTAAGGTTSLCPGATQVITVAANGSGNYTTIQAAINSISSSNTKLIQVNVKAGTYAEQVTINKPFVCMVGDSATTTIITHTAGTDIVNGGTVLLTGSDFSASNITFENSAGDGAGQAVALMANGNRQQFINCRFVSYQDTLYTNTGTQYFKNCYIQGDTDYIFGDATAVFEGCTMNNVASGTAVTAPRTPQNTTYGLVFIGGSLTANPTTSTVPNNHVYLGRPWGPYGAVTYLNVAMGAHINADGWTTMSNNDLTYVRFYEYKSTGPGANPTNATRVNRQLTDAQAANYTVSNVLKPWVPSYSQ